MPLLRNTLGVLMVMAASCARESGTAADDDALAGRVDSLADALYDANYDTNPEAA